MDADHGLVERAGFIGMLGQILKDRGAVDLVEDDFAGADAVDQMAVADVVLFAQHRGQRPQRTAVIAAQAIGHRREVEAAVGLLGKNAVAGQRPQQSIERRGVGAGGGGQFSAVFRPAAMWSARPSLAAT